MSPWGALRQKTIPLQRCVSLRGRSNFRVAGAFLGAGFRSRNPDRRYSEQQSTRPDSGLSFGPGAWPGIPENRSLRFSGWRPPSAATAPAPGQGRVSAWRGEFPNVASSGGPIAGRIGCTSWAPAASRSSRSVLRCGYQYVQPKCSSRLELGRSCGLPMNPSTQAPLQQEIFAFSTAFAESAAAGPGGGAGAQGSQRVPVGDSGGVGFFDGRLHPLVKRQNSSPALRASRSPAQAETRKQWWQHRTA